jgi:hypothetical protein
VKRWYSSSVSTRSLNLNAGAAGKKSCAGSSKVSGMRPMPSRTVLGPKIGSVK